MAESWRAYLVETMTGRLGHELAIISGTWDEPVNAAGEIKVVAEKEPLRRVEASRWWEPGANTILVTVDGEPLVAGPLLRPPKLSGDGATAEFTAGSGLSLFEHRFGLVRDFRPGQETEMAASVLGFEHMSLGSIMWRLIEGAMGKRGGFLPVVHGSPDEVGLTSGHERHYKGFDVANLGVAHLIGLLSGVIGGPDFAFRPRWADSSRRRMEWVFVHGTVAAPELPQSRELVIDATRPRADVVDAQVHTAYEPVARVYGTGAGTDAGTLLSIVEDADRLSGGVPVVERVWSDTSIENPGLLERHAAAQLAVAGQTLVQVNSTMECSRELPVTSWHAGDLATVRIGERWWPVPEVLRQRVIKRGGRLGSRLVDVESQCEVVIGRGRS